MFTSGKKTVGLDIGTSSIKIAEVEVSKKGVELLSFSVVPTPPQCLNGGDITDLATLGRTIHMLVQEIKTKRKNITFGLWGTSVIIKKITIPTVDKKLLREQIRFEAEQYIPFDINQITLAHVVLENQPSLETMEVLLIAAQNEIIIQHHQLAELSTMKNSIIDVSGFALANSFEANYGKARGETICLMNIGNQVTNFVIVHDGETIFCRDIPVGGSIYTNEIHKTMGLSIQESESMKICASSSQEVPDEVHSIMSASNEILIEEFRNTIDFFSATNGQLNIARIFYTGGGSLTPGLVETMQNALQIPCEQMNSFQTIRFSKNIDPQFIQQINIYSSVVMGLAMRMVGDHD